MTRNPRFVCVCRDLVLFVCVGTAVVCERCLHAHPHAWSSGFIWVCVQKRKIKHMFEKAACFECAISTYLCSFDIVEKSQIGATLKHHRRCCAPVATLFFEADITTPQEQLRYSPLQSLFKHFSSQSFERLFSKKKREKQSLHLASQDFPLCLGLK